MLVKVCKSQKALDIFDTLRIFSGNYSNCFGKAHLDSSWVAIWGNRLNNQAYVFGFVNLKLAFVNIQLQASSLKVGQNSLDMLSVLLKVLLKTRMLSTYAITKKSRTLFSKSLLMKF